MLIYICKQKGKPNDTQQKITKGMPQQLIDVDGFINSNSRTLRHRDVRDTNMKDFILSDTALQTAQQESNRYALYFLRIEGGTGAFNKADIIVDAGEADESSEKFESNWEYRQRADRMAINWIERHRAKTVKLFVLRSGRDKKLLKTFNR